MPYFSVVFVGVLDLDLDLDLYCTIPSIKRDIEKHLGVVFEISQEHLIGWLCMYLISQSTTMKNPKQYIIGLQKYAE